MTELKVKTHWGKRRGWEIQHLMLGTMSYDRVTWVGGCRPATPEEVEMWRELKRLKPEEFKVVK